MTDLERAIQLASTCHAGQVDKSGKPYILHLIRVMMAMESEKDMIAAVLHDIVEDCHVGHGDILALFGEEVWAAVIALTRKEEETYEEFIHRAKGNEIAKRVKFADVMDNMRPGAEHLRPRYEKAIAALAHP